MDSKVCSSCRKEKPLSCFHKDAWKTLGYHHQCKQCKNSYKTVRHEKFKAAINRKNSDRYKALSPERKKVISLRARTRIPAGAGVFTAKELRRLYDKQRGRCADCAKKLKKYDADHITPLSKGGSNVIYNIQLLCPRCNRGKFNRDPIDHAQSLGRLL